jgi:small subunit ribosomal protein S6
MTATGTEPATPAGKQTAAVNAPKRAPSARDMAGRKREYETIYILRPDSTTDVIAQVNQKIRTVIETGGGTLLKVDNWGKRKLAYEVKKQLKGIYLFFAYLGTAGIVEEVERNLRLTDSVIRYYSVKIAENVDGAARTSEVTEESFAKASTPGPDEEAIATGQAEARSPFEDEEGAFDFEEAVFGGVDEPGRGGGRKDG